MLQLLRQCAQPDLVAHIESSFSDGTHSSLWCCAINASSGVSGAVTERLWGTNTICYSSLDQETASPLGACSSRVCTHTENHESQHSMWTGWCCEGFGGLCPLSCTPLIFYALHCLEISLSKHLQWEILVEDSLCIKFKDCTLFISIFPVISRNNRKQTVQGNRCIVLTWALNVQASLTRLGA